METIIVKETTINNLDKGNNPKKKESMVSELKNIKSLFQIKYIFSFLHEKTKLYLLIYSKSFQKILNFNIEYYKNYSRRYKIMEKDGNGKEFYAKQNTLCFVGKYLNNKRNGKGKEYHCNGKLKFEGEYLNGIKIYGIGYDYHGEEMLKIKEVGNGEEFYYNGSFKFKGEYFNAKKWNGKGYDIKGNLKYEIKNGKGFVKEYDKKGKLIKKMEMEKNLLAIH